VLENYADNQTFRFTDTLKKFVVILEPQKLTEAEKSVCLRRRLGLRWLCIESLAQDIDDLRFVRTPVWTPN